MPHEVASPPFLRKLLEAAGWEISAIPAGWRATEPPPGTRVLLAYGERELPAGFQKQVPDSHGEVLILFGHPPSPHEVDRVELVGGRVVGPEEAPETVLGLLRPSPSTNASGGSAPAEGGGAENVPPNPPTAPPIEDPSSYRETILPPVASAPVPYEAPRAEPDRTPPGPIPLRPSETLLRQDPLVFPPQVFETDRIVKPRLHEEDLRRMALGRWRGGSPRLVLVPFFLFAYALPEDEEASSAPPRLVAVPAVGGAPQFWPAGEREIISAIGHPHHRPRRRIDADEARLLALEAVRERHARNEETAEQRRGMLVIENRRHPRGAEEVRLGPPAWVWVPHWVVEAWNGREILDAVTGLPAHLPLEHDEGEGRE